MDTPQTRDPKAKLTRRRLLGSAATVAGIAAVDSALPANIRNAVAAGPVRRGKLSDIEHVVLLMQENRSFDHYFGTLSGVRGFSDPMAAKLPTGDSVFKQPDPAGAQGYMLPYHLETKTTNAQAIPSMSHAWKVQHAAWNGGRMDNWLPAHRAADGDGDGVYTMGHYTREDIPFQFALAENFTVLDHYHCSVMGPTHPNRYMWMTGTIDPGGLAGGPALDNNAPTGTYSWTTYPERLLQAGVDFKFYHEEGSVTGVALIQHMKQYMSLTPDSELYKRTMASSPVGQFQYDAMNDRLPTVSWICPPSSMNEHPANLPAAGATFVASIVDAIAANPEVWAKTAFILSYDENDGLFDHVVPPTPPAGTPDEIVTKTSVTGVDGAGLPVGLGFRVPCIIVSPWTVGGWVSSEVADHTSQLRFLEAVTGVKEPNISDWRRRTVGDLTSAFRFHEAAKPAPVLPGTTAQYDLAQYEVKELPKPTIPPADQQMPRQEPGKRPHTP
ncbi:alkaline phosphatase family protein [Streptomyces sp. TS71-3]|uniref:alkaline phosphatase family protein n=1 Tax=Streptomyces sp. TS71-3 TaxID=2733862 RepID=UPI001B1830CB|nr:alkaline phosphatase family protein [Streptomyces sp. TS71-3]GHJ37031.1 putative non-hemolytic phospholipase C [Streptomyces sp. TS71-3]